METTGKAAVEFWKWVGDKGLVNSNTAAAFKAAASQVLGVLDNWESLDVQALDTEDVFRRFVNKRGRDFTPGSLSTYKRRFNLALSDFIAYTKAPDSWKPSVQDRPARREARVNAPSANGAGTPERIELGLISPIDLQPSPHTTSTRTGLVEYPFPLREGRFAYLRLPSDLSAGDVKRLTAYLATLVIDDAV